MHSVEPEVHIVAETEIDSEGLRHYLEALRTDWESDAATGVEEVIEVMGRSCYKSYEVGLNPNIVRTRGSSKEYVENLIKVQHGSVLEHAWVSFMFTNVSRVFTHELVRHRVGVAISQESLRFVRLTDLGMWIPSCFRSNPKAEAIFRRVWMQAQDSYAELLSEDVLEENIDDAPLARKKELTSAARRVAPIGLATNIGWSCNMRTLRHVIEMRTAPEAEEEIRLVFGKVAQIAVERWPALFEDYEEKDGSWVTEKRKI